MFEVFPSDFFKKEIKKLIKKYRHIKADILPLIEKLESGKLVGNPISGFGNKLYKVRIASSDQQKGKSGGFRIIYYVILNEKEIVLLTTYAKAKQENIRKEEIKKILNQLGL